MVVRSLNPNTHVSQEVGVNEFEGSISDQGKTQKSEFILD